MANISYRAASTLTNRYGWNGGNEYEDEGELNYSNTFYRKYDAQIGRFTGVDMLAEKYAGINPYQFGYNNPVMFNDPSGDQASGNGRVINGRQQKGPDGNYHTGWVSEMMWNKVGFFDWSNQGGASGDYFNIEGGSSSRILNNLSLGQSYNSVYGPKDYSKAWQNIFNSLPAGADKVTFKNTPGGSGTISGYYYGNQSGSGEYVRQEYGGETTYAASEDYHYTGYIAAIDFSSFLDGGGGSGGNGSGGGFGGLGSTIWQAGIPPASAPAKDPLLKFVGFRDGWIPEFESRLLGTYGKGSSAAMTPGPFIVYPTGGSTVSFYNTHEPGHVLQFYLLGPVNYTTGIIIPSLLTASLDPSNHTSYPWETSADKLWSLYNWVIH
jgi:RHS repeat-associated protein